MILDENTGLSKVEPRATNLRGNSDEIQGIYNNQNGKTIGFTIDVKTLKVIIEGEEGKIEPTQPDNDQKEDNNPTNTPETAKRDKNESLLMWIKSTNETGYYDVDITVDGTTYTYPVYLKVITDAQTTYSQDISLSGELDETEFTNNILNKRSLIYKYKGDLKIDNGVSLTAYTSKKVKMYYQKNKVNYENGEEYCQGPLGLFIYVEGTFTNNGTVTMKDRGARPESQIENLNVIMWKYGSGNNLKNYYYVGRKYVSRPVLYYSNSEGPLIKPNYMYKHTYKALINRMNGFYDSDGKEYGYRGSGTGRFWLWIF